MNQSPGIEQDPTTRIKVEDIIAEMDDLGRAKWDAAFARVEAKMLRAELARVVNDQQAQSTEPYEAPTVVPDAG